MNDPLQKPLPVDRPSVPLPWNVHPTVLAHLDRTSSIAEQYRGVRTWLLRQRQTGRNACIAITSSLPHEGKSVTTANLAVSMAEVRHMQVLAVDCDFRQAALARLYRMANAPGLADVLIGRARLDDAIGATPLGNLSLLSAGASEDHNPTELLNSSTAARVFDEIRERFQYILVDTPPVQGLCDVGVIGALCTGLLLVVRMRKTSAAVARQSVQWMKANHLNVLGTVATGCTVKAAHGAYQTIDERD